MILFQVLNDVAAFWFAELVPALVQSSVVALLCGFVVILGRRWRAPLRHGLLVVALFKFAVPPALVTPLGLLQHLPPVAVRSVRPSVEATAPASLTGSGARRLEPHASVPQPSGVGPAADRRCGFMLLHLAGSIAVLGWILVQEIGLRRLRSRGTSLEDGPLHAMHIDLCGRLGLRRQPRLLLSEQVATPAAFGVFDPTVVVPHRLARELSPDELRMVLAHELAHHRRGDLWMTKLQAGLSILWWFDPVFWWLAGRLRSAREDCCDDLVLARGLSSGESYCRTLLAAARASLPDRRLGPAVTCGLGGHPLGRRLTRLMQASFEPAAGISRVQAAVLLTLALVLLPGAGTPASETGTTRTRTAPLGSNDRRQLLRQLDSEDPMQRAIAATELGEHAEEGAIPHLVDLLADEAPLAKLPGWAGNNEWSPARSSWSQPSPGEAAAIALASMSARAAPALIAALQRPEPAARRNAAWALGELHHPRLEGLPEITPLVAASRDPDASVRAASAWALGEVKDRRATEPLLLMLRDPDAAARREAARALGELADPKAADELLEALLDSDSQVRTAAAWALEEIRDRIGDTARRRGY